MSHWLAQLIRLFPEAFRHQFGADMIDQVEIEYQAARTKGRFSALLFSSSTASDLLRSIVAEHWAPSWKGPPPYSKRTNQRTTKMENWITDFRHAARTLSRSPGFSLAIIATLGLAIGINAGIFSVVDTVLLDPLPYRDSDRLVRIAASAPGTDMPSEFGVSPEFYVHYRENSELLEDVALYNSFTNTFRTADRTERIRMSLPSTSLFSTLGAIPILGRIPVDEDADRVMVLSYALWKTWFGSDPDILGQRFKVFGEDRTVIAVMGSDFWFPNEGTMLWIPQVVDPEDITPGRFGQPLLARLAPGATLPALEEELGRLAHQLPEIYGGSAEYARILTQHHQPIIRSLHQELLGEASQPLWILLGAVGLLLLIACANVANLFMVRAERRRRDLAVQRAMGASRAQVIRTLMAEALLLAALAGLLAVGLAWAAVPLLLQIFPGDLPRLASVSLNGPTLLFTLVASFFTAVLCGLFPAIKASSVDLSQLREAGRGTTRRKHWARNGLVVVQTALALVLLIGSSLLTRSFSQLRQVDPGYDTHNLFTFQIAPEGTHLNDAASFARFHKDFAESVRALPGVESVGLVENVPLNEGVRSTRFRTEESAVDEDSGPLIGYTWASGNYFATMGIEQLSGRAFRDAEDISSQGNVILSQTAADLLWPGQDPVDRRLRTDNEEPWLTVIGVVEDVLQYGLRDKPEPLLYLPMVGLGDRPRALSSPAYVVRTGRTHEIGPEIRELVKQIAPNAPMYRTFTMEGLAADSMTRLSRTTLTLGLAAAIALLLGAIGLYGVLSYVVAERTREIGVRMAIGAAPRQVQMMVVSQGIRIVLVGVVFGLLAALGITRVLGSLLFEVATVDVAVFAGTAALMMLVGLAATYVPARQASIVDPLRSLSTD